MSINNRDQSIDEILNLSELLIYEDVPIEDLPLGNKYPQKIVLMLMLMLMNLFIKLKKYSILVN